MMRMRVAAVRVAAALGWPGMFGFALAAFAAACYFSTLRPAQWHLDDLRAELTRAPRVAVRAPASPAERLQAFYGYLPRHDQLPQMLGTVFAAAKREGLKLDQAEYRVASNGAVTRFEFTLPLQGSYPQIRRFVDAAMAEVATLALDSIQFERQKIGDGTLEVKVKMRVFMAGQS